MTFEGGDAILSPGPEMRRPEGEADLSLRPKTLYEALGPLQESTGVNFWRYIASRYQVELHPKAVGPEKGVKAKQEEVRSSVEDVEDLRPYFRDGVEGRTYFFVLGRLDHPDRPEDEWRDYVIMEEALNDGTTALMIFEWPDTEHAYAAECRIKGQPFKTNYLRLRFGVITALGESAGDDCLIVNDAEPLLRVPESKPVGLLSKEQTIPSGYKGIVGNGWCLLKDGEIEVKTDILSVMSKYFWDTIFIEAAKIRDNLSGTTEEIAGNVMQEVTTTGSLAKHTGFLQACMRLSPPKTI